PPAIARTIASMVEPGDSTTLPWYPVYRGMTPQRSAASAISCEARAGGPAADLRRPCSPPAGSAPALLGYASTRCAPCAARRLAPRELGPADGKRLQRIRRQLVWRFDRGHVREDHTSLLAAPRSRVHCMRCQRVPRHRGDHLITRAR